MTPPPPPDARDRSVGRAWLVDRSVPTSVGLETTLVVHGVPRSEGPGLAAQLSEDVASGGGSAAVVGVVGGRAVVGMTGEELGRLFEAEGVPKVNGANLGAVLARGGDGATTVSATIEACAAAGVRVFATGAIGGVHRGYGTAWDVSADLAALSRFPVAVVSSGVKSLLDVEATREALETLGVPVVGFGTDVFPAFYARSSGVGVDAVFGDVGSLGEYLAFELARSGRGVVVANPIPARDGVDPATVDGWLLEATARAERAGARGRAVTPAVLAALHEVSGGATLRANIALARSNARVGGGLAAAMAGSV